MILTVHVTEATGFTLLGVMETTSPIHRNIAFATVESRCALHAAAGADAAKFEQPIKDGTVITYVELSLLFRVGVHIVWGDLGKKLNVLVRVELSHLKLVGRLRPLFHELLETRYYERRKSGDISNLSFSAVAREYLRRFPFACRGLC